MTMGGFLTFHCRKMIDLEHLSLHKDRNEAVFILKYVLSAVLLLSHVACRYISITGENNTIK
jgi:hypothetical protein